jgi:hypothetical protein
VAQIVKPLFLGKLSFLETRYSLENAPAILVYHEFRDNKNHKNSPRERSYFT